MPSIATTINGATGSVADLTIAPITVSGGTSTTGTAISQAVQFNDVTITAETEQMESATFSDEPNDVITPTSTRLTLDGSGILKKGTTATGPLIPPPQNVAIVTTFDTGCTISATFNFVRATARRVANNMASLTGSARSTGPIVKAWVQA